MTRSHSDISSGHVVSDSQQSPTSTPALVSEERSDQMTTPSVNITTPATDQDNSEGGTELESGLGTVKITVVVDNFINRKISVRY
jgi:hypothetical protein